MRLVFLDHSNILQSENINIKFNTPKKENIILENTELHEGKYNGYFTIIQNPIDNKIRLYYRAQNDCKNYHHGGFTCYAESTDGINFIKPELNLHEYNKSKKNNIILNEICASHNFSPFYDINTNTYKAIGGQHLFDSHYKKSNNGLYFHEKCKNNVKLLKHSKYSSGNNKNGSYVDPSIFNVSRTMGHKFITIIFKIILPLVYTNILVGGILVFVDVLKELPMTLLLRPFNFETLATYVYQYASDEMLEESSLAAIIIILAGLGPIILLSLTIKKLSTKKDSMTTTEILTTGAHS